MCLEHKSDFVTSSFKTGNWLLSDLKIKTQILNMCCMSFQPHLIPFSFLSYLADYTIFMLFPAMKMLFSVVNLPLLPE